jgi:hypothetical protein
MRPVPSNFDLGALVGQDLTQLRIGAWQLQILFESENMIACEGRVVVETQGNSIPVLTDDGWGDLAALKGLVGQQVLSWQVDGTHEFSITLSGNTKLRFQSRTGPHEDFVIHPQLVVI